MDVCGVAAEIPVANGWDTPSDDTLLGPRAFFAYTFLRIFLRGSENTCGRVRKWRRKMGGKWAQKMGGENGRAADARKWAQKMGAPKKGAPPGAGCCL